MIIDNDIKLDFKDVLIKPKRSTLSSRSQVDLARDFTFKFTDTTLKCVPVVVANMDTTGTFEMARVMSKNDACVAIHKHYTFEEWIEFAKQYPECTSKCIVSSGVHRRDLDKLYKIYTAIPDLKMVCLDVANGYSEAFVECIKEVRKHLPDAIIIAGNVVTPEMTEQLIVNGADIVKVGIGPGSVCTTRKQTGVGYPQLSAIIECADAAHGMGGRIMADGGCKVPGDFAKAFGAGADFVMSGGVFAGHDESGGDIEEIDGKEYMFFYGMSSAKAMQKYAGGVANYRSSEGKVVRIPYRGGVQNTITDLFGGLRSTCTYVGSSNLKELSKRTTFVRTTEQLNTVFNQWNI
uniref:GMP reductase n=1 Tax=Megaviridae environmental sample TaxID=1737588 RepID=A0A5J6VJ34_9VIRU|nr:MAG: IMP dehydrogenase / GMP reductase domain protein [Megaviridae environmental sample]